MEKTQWGEECESIDQTKEGSLKSERRQLESRHAEVLEVLRDEHDEALEPAPRVREVPGHQRPQRRRREGAHVVVLQDRPEPRGAVALRARAVLRDPGVELDGRSPARLDARAALVPV